MKAAGKNDPYSLKPWGKAELGERMEIKKEYYPELIEDKGARILTPYLEIKVDENGERVGKVIATDGRILVVVAVTVGPNDFEGWIPTLVLKAGRKATLKCQSVIRIVCGEKAFLLSDLSTIARSENDRRMPDWRGIVEQMNKRSNVHTVSFNPEMLLILAKAIGSSQKVTIDFQGTGKPMVVRGDHGEEIDVSLMMPMS